MPANPLRGFAVDRAQIRRIGHDLQRPECILAEPDGTLWSADARGGVTDDGPDEHFGFQWSCVSCDYNESVLT